MPFEGGGLPGVWRCVGSFAQAVDEIEEEEELGGGEEDRGVGDEAVERECVGKEQAGGAECAAGARDAGELSVVAGFAGEAGEMHGEEDGVGTGEGEPEVEVAEGLGEEAAGVSAGSGEQ